MSMLVDMHPGPLGEICIPVLNCGLHSQHGSPSLVDPKPLHCDSLVMNFLQPSHAYSQEPTGGSPGPSSSSCHCDGGGVGFNHGISGKRAPIHTSDYLYPYNTTQ
eukprot:gnl/MRDRNA2_/MRDRNA2_341007_c0_seq1.p1 gnl/MRDRNA2_/MRDRNA2_341007_c0~~gnl/MRDRNA2_/MRDRNA2_341007_c0_seq1.p1  ORF type:complete len:105 (+),score=1.04 gnl/MRDRNA2_/MRDRNA2_341007_c0_seq1:120-434(+)